MRQNGFSSLELLVATFIIGLAILFGYFSFDGYLENIKLVATARLTTNQLRLAKQEARSLSRDIEVRLKGDAISITASPPQCIKLPQGIVFEGEKTFKFASTGYPPPGFSGSVCLKSKRSQKKVVVSSLGRIRIE